MSLPLIPPPLDALRHRPFSFYPAILNIQHNEWQFRKSTWSEVLVVNTRTSQEIWIPRRFLGEVSAIEDPVVIVGLVQELEYKSGAVWPYQRRVIQMPVAVGAPRGPRPAAPRSGPAPVIGIRVESRSDSQIFRLVGGALLVGIVAAYFAVNFCRPVKDQDYRRLTAADDYDSVVRQLGAPWHDRWQSGEGQRRYRALVYPDRGYTVLLLAEHSRPALYIGTVDSHWNPLHAVDGRLRELPRF
jgi:hypothetical protein